MTGLMKRLLAGIFILIVVSAGIAWYGTPVLTKKIASITQQKLDSLGIHASVSVNIWKRAIRLDSITYATPLRNDSLHTRPHQVFIATLQASGIHILPFINDKKIIINTLVLTDGAILYNKAFKKSPTDSTTPLHNQPIVTGIELKRTLITNISATVMHDTLAVSTGTLNKLRLDDLEIRFQNDTVYRIGNVEVDLQRIAYKKPGDLHGISVARAIYTSKREALEVDSFKIIPAYNKNDFARIAKIQKTRLDILLPKIVMQGIKHQRFFADSTIEVSRTVITDGYVHAYRDKHYPFVRNRIMPLPIEGIRQLPFNIKSDTILIRNANIAYEEFSEKGLPQPGTITFNSLNATLSGLSTVEKNPDSKAFSTLTAECRVMNSGVLNATFKLPLNSTMNYEASGSIRNMNLTSLNPALGYLTHMEIRSGILNDLRFTFSYNDNTSTGEVLLNYSNLKLRVLNQDGSSIHKVLSGVINAVVRSDKDKTVDKSKRTGVINIERDKKRFVFQLWWQSILNGLQSTFMNKSTTNNKGKARGGG